MDVQEVENYQDMIAEECDSFVPLCGVRFIIGLDPTKASGRGFALSIDGEVEDVDLVTLMGMWPIAQHQIVKMISAVTVDGVCDGGVDSTEAA